jgi:hypothetical protein
MTVERYRATYHKPQEYWCVEDRATGRIVAYGYQSRQGAAMAAAGRNGRYARHTLRQD